MAAERGLSNWVQVVDPDVQHVPTRLVMPSSYVALWQIRVPGDKELEAACLGNLSDGAGGGILVAAC